MDPSNLVTGRKSLVVFGPLSTPHTDNWIKLIDPGCYNIYPVTVHPRASSLSGNSEKYFYKAFRFLLAPILLIWEMVRRRAQLVLAHYFSSYGLVALLCGFRPVLVCWGSDVNVFSKKFPGLFRLACLLADRRARSVIVPSDAIKQIFISNGLSADKVFVLQYGCDISRLDCFFRRAFRADRTLKIASIRNGDSLYQIDKIVNAYICMNSNVDTELVIFGGGHTDYKVDHDLWPGKKITHAGYCAPSEFYERLSDCDIFVSIPTRDGLSLAVLEALALGVEPILSNVGSYFDLFQDLGVCFVDSEIDEADLADSIASIVSRSSRLSDHEWKERRYKLSGFVRSRYDSSEAADSLASIIRR